MWQAGKSSCEEKLIGTADKAFESNFLIVIGSSSIVVVLFLIILVNFKNSNNLGMSN